MFAKVNSTFPDGLTPVVRGDFLRFSAVSSNLPDTRGEESVDISLVSNSTSNVAPIFLAELLVLASIQIDLVDVVGAKGVALVIHLDHHLSVSPGGVMHLSPLVALFAM